MSRRSLFGAVAGMLLVAATPARALHHYRVGIDLDDDPSVGCDLSLDASAPPIIGLELLLDLSVDPAQQPPMVVAATLTTCNVGTGVFGAPQALGGGWPVGVGGGVAAADVVEGFLPRGALGTARVARVVFVAQSSAGAVDVLDAIDGRAGGRPLLLALGGPAPAPALGPEALVAAVVVLVGVALRRRRRGAWASAAIVLVVGALGVAAAAHLANGDASDWSAHEMLATDSPSDAQPADPAAEIIAGFAAATFDAVWVRVDIASVAGAPPSATPTATRPPSPTAVDSGTATLTITATPTVSVTPSATAVATPTDTTAPTLTVTTAPTATDTPSATATDTPSPSATDSSTATPTPTLPIVTNPTVDATKPGSGSTPPSDGTPIGLTPVEAPTTSGPGGPGGPAPTTPPPGSGSTPPSDGTPIGLTPVEAPTTSGLGGPGVPVPTTPPPNVTAIVGPPAPTATADPTPG